MVLSAELLSPITGYSIDMLSRCFFFHVTSFSSELRRLVVVSTLISAVLIDTFIRHFLNFIKQISAEADGQSRILQIHFLRIGDTYDSYSYNKTNKIALISKIYFLE